LEESPIEEQHKLILHHFVCIVLHLHGTTMVAAKVISRFLT
jgi:hypothetical protein